MRLDPEQRHVVKNIVAIGKKRGVKKRDIVAALETGIVEQSLHNQPGGGGSSSGWRQETASSYPNVNRLDLRGSINRFYDEIKGVGGSSGSAAQAVQRSAFPARYAQHKGEALQLLHKFAGSSGSKQASPSVDASGKKVTAQVTVPGVDNSGQRKQLLLDYLNVRDQPDSLLNLASGLKSAQDVPAQTLTKSIKIPGQKSDQGTSKSLGGDAVKKNGLGNFEGHKVAAWIVPQLQYARAHGWKGPVTSGYRSHAYNVAQGRTYHSQHEETGYGKGAVDFGGMQDAAGLANREAFFRALKGYKGRTVQRPKGFRDDGHTSGTGG